MNKKLKLTKLTISNLDRVKGGLGLKWCYCEDDPTGSPNAAYNLENRTVVTLCIPTCDTCPAVTC